MVDPLGSVATIIDLFGTVRNFVNTGKKTWDCYKELFKIFEKFLRELDACEVQLIGFKSSYNLAKDELSDELKQSYITLISSHKEKLDEIKADLEGLKTKIPKSGISSGVRPWAKALAMDRKIVARASRTSEMISEFAGELKKISKECHDEMKSLHEKRSDQFTPHFHKQSLENVILKMNDNKTAEGQLKQGVMTEGEATAVLGNSPRNDASSSGCGGTTSVEGLGGIGKTTALQGLATDKDIKNWFSDGVLFMTFGKDADEKKLKENFCMIVRQSGGKKLCKSIENSTLQEVTDETVKWFKDKKILFICDDLWPTASNTIGWLTELKKLTQSSSTCHLVLSTRYGEIASKACRKSGTVVKFKTLDVTGRRAHDVLLKYADVSDTDFQSLSDKEKSVVQEILVKCEGLYLALAVAGGILLDSKVDWSLAVAVRKLCSTLSEKEEDLLDGSVEEHSTTLYCCFEESLERVHEWAKKHGLGDFWFNTIPRLCVYQKNTKLTKEMMKWVWLVESYVDKLLKKLRNFHLLEFDKSAELYTFHDLFHDFCIRKVGGEREVYKLHREFLDNAAKRFGIVNLGESTTERVCGRSWWNLPDGGGMELYMRTNLAWHLKEAGNDDELEALMTRFEWTLFRFKKNDYNEMMNDLSIWVNHEEKKWREGKEERNEYIKKRQMRQAISSAWSKSDNEKELTTHVLGHLLESREVSKFANSYIDSVESIGMKMWLRPSQQIWEVPTEDVIDVQFWVCNISVNWEADEAIVVGAEGQIALVNLSTLAVSVLNIDGNRKVTCVARSKNGKTVVLGSKEGEIVLWDERSRQTVRTICNIGYYVRSVAVSDDGSRAAFSCRRTVYVYDVEKGQELRKLEGHTDEVNCVTMSGDGSFVASGSSDKNVRVWDVEKKESCQLEGHTNRVNSVAMSGDGRRVASGAYDDTVHVWEGGKKKVSFKCKGHGQAVGGVAMNKDGSRVMAGFRDYSIGVWDVENKEILCLFEGHRRTVKSVAMNEEGSRIASGSWDKTVRVWDVEKGKKVSVYEGHERWEEIFAISGEGSRIIAGSHPSWTMRSENIYVWDVFKKVVLCELTGRVDNINSVTFCGDGSRVAFGSQDYSVCVWNVGEAQEVCNLEGHNNRVNSVSMSRDGSRVASGSVDNTVRVWDVEKGQELCKFEDHTNDVYSVTMSGDGSRIASGSEDNTVRVWSVERKEELCNLVNHTRGVISVAMSIDGCRVVSSSYDKTVRVWDVEEKKEICKLEGHKGLVYNVIINADGSCIASRSQDGTLMVFKARDDSQGPLHQNYMLFQKLHLSYTMGIIFHRQQIVMSAKDRSMKYDLVE